MATEGKNFLDSHKEGLEILGFWTEHYRESIIAQIEQGYKTEVIREFGISDIVINEDKILLKWYKRFEPLTDEEINNNYGR